MVKIWNIDNRSKGWSSVNIETGTVDLNCKQKKNTKESTEESGYQLPQYYPHLSVTLNITLKP